MIPHEWFQSKTVPLTQKKNTNSKAQENSDNSMVFDEDKLLSLLEGVVEELQFRNQTSSKRGDSKNNDIEEDKPTSTTTTTKDDIQIVDKLEVGKLELELQERKIAEANLLGQLDQLNKRLASERLQHENEIRDIKVKQQPRQQSEVDEAYDEKVRAKKRLERYEELLLERDSEIERLQKALDEKHGEIEKQAEEERKKLEAKYVTQLDKKNQMIQVLQLKIKQTKKKVLELLAEDIRNM